MRPCPRILFQIHNRRGLGHMMRGLNIAEELRSLAPGAEVLFYTRHALPQGLPRADLTCFVENDGGALAHWPLVVRAFRPHGIVYDTLLPRQSEREPEGGSARRIYIMRKCQEARQREVFAHPFLDQVELIVIPHTQEEFGYEVPACLAQKAFFSGPIVRMPDPAGQERLRQKYGMRAGDFVLTSTAGGGGFEHPEGTFFETVFLVHRRLRSRLPNLRHLVIPGPNFGGVLEPLDGMIVARAEPELVSLIAISDVVIAEGGYNTVNEIRTTKTPAVFLPGRRSHDDQEERVRALEREGLAFVLSGLPPEEAARRITDLCATPAALEQVRRRYQADRMEPGNRKAAQEILDLVTR